MRLARDLSAGDYLAYSDEHTDDRSGRCGMSDPDLWRLDQDPSLRGLALAWDDDGIRVVEARTSDRTVGMTNPADAPMLAPSSPTPPVEPIMQFFAFEHLPEHLKEVSRPFGALADQLVGTLPRNAERTVALRKLLESKDAAVRAALAK